MEKYEIMVPHGIQYISEWEEYQLPKGHIIVDKGVTGCGYTEYCLTNSENIVLCSPRRLLLENKSDQHKLDSNILYLRNDVENYDGVQHLKEKAKEHWRNCLGPFGGAPCKIMVTYDSCHYVIEALRELGVLDTFTFVSDEFQSIFGDAFLKSEVEFSFVEVLQECPNVIYLSATPMLDKYLERVPEFKDLPYQILNWSETGGVEQVIIQKKNVNSIFKAAEEVIQNYLDGKFPIRQDKDGKLVESKEAIFYLNSVTDILRLVRAKKLTPENTRILCANTPENRAKLKKLSTELKLTTEFEVGRVPLKGETNPMFLFCTSSTNMGIDLYSDCASTFVLADPNFRHLALDPSQDLPQIVGRLRNRENPYKNDITMFFKKNSLPKDKSEFDNLQEERRKESNNLLEGFKNLTQEQKSSYLKKLRKDIPTSKYSDDFVGISKNTGLPVYNYFIEVANERAWEVSQEDYRDKISVTRSLEEQGFIVKDYHTEEDIILQDFLDNHFYQTGIFHEKMRMYCEFRDTYGENPKIVTSLDFKIKDPRFKIYYEYFGTSRCKALQYRENELAVQIKTASIGEKGFVDMIYSYFKEGDKYPMSEIKKILNEFREKLGMSGKAKATDLGGYFKISKTRITLQDKTIVPGFKLGEKLK